LKKKKTELLHILEITGYIFQPTNVNFDIDTINKKKQDVNLIISDYSYQEKILQKRTFQIYKISDVNIYADYSQTTVVQNSLIGTTYKVLISTLMKIKYKPHAITDAIFITKEAFYSKTVLTTRYLNNLKIFTYPFNTKSTQRHNIQLFDC
jgi:hypothetical protein